MNFVSGTPKEFKHQNLCIEVQKLIENELTNRPRKNPLQCLTLSDIFLGQRDSIFVRTSYSQKGGAGILYEPESKRPSRHKMHLHFLDVSS